MFPIDPNWSESAGVQLYFILMKIAPFYIDLESDPERFKWTKKKAIIF